MSQTQTLTQTSRQVHVGSIKSLFDDLIDRHADAYLAAYPEVKEFSAFEKSGTINYYIGMVWTSDNEKPDSSQLKIMGSQSLAKNKVLELDLSSVDSQQSFFPGQIVAFSADPHLKQQLTVKKFLDPMRIAPSTKRIDTESDIKLILASGPFMRPEQEDWTLFDKMIESIRDNEATHVVLVGPFIDLENTILRAQYDSSWKMVFDKLVNGLRDLSCKVFLVPSNRDVLPCSLSSNYFYPCSKIDFDYNKKDAKCTITSVSDPAQIDLGGLYLDVTSAEILFHLNKSTLFINKAPGHTFTSIFRHLLTHGIYPLYPAPNDIAIDYPKLSKHLQLDRLAPHLLILPTRFQTAVSEVEDRLVIAVHKCSLKKQLVMIEVPRIESSEEAPIRSILLANYKYKIIDIITTVT